MMNSINKIQLLGHLGMDPEIKNLNGGKTLVRMSLATNESYRDKKGEFQTSTQWHSITAWGKLGEAMAQKLKKGSFVMIHGKLQNSEWEAKDGSKRYATNVVANEYMLLNRDRSSATKRTEAAVEA